jgi:hypothetical protein
MPAFPPVTTYNLPDRSGNASTEKALLGMAGCMYGITWAISSAMSKLPQVE